MNRTILVIILICFTSMAITAQPAPSVGFLEFVSERVSKGSGKTPEKLSVKSVCPIDENVLARRVFSEYGSMFSASEKVTLPPTCIFSDESEVGAFRTKLHITQLTINGVNLLLQKEAADALSRVIADAALRYVTIAPLDGTIAAGRTYYETTRIWNSRFEPALRYWVQTGMITPEEETSVRAMKLPQQVEKVIEWESKGYLFGTGRARSIFSSTAPPGTSQHIALLAFDLAPPLTPDKRSLMNANGWYQTVKGDPHHFTFLGMPEIELPKRGLKAILFESNTYWVPNL